MTMVPERVGGAASGETSPCGRAGEKGRWQVGQVTWLTASDGWALLDMIGFFPKPGEVS